MKIPVLYNRKTGEISYREFEDQEAFERWREELRKRDSSRY